MPGVDAQVEDSASREHPARLAVQLQHLPSAERNEGARWALGFSFHRNADLTQPDEARPEYGSGTKALVASILTGCTFDRYAAAWNAGSTASTLSHRGSGSPHRLREWTAPGLDDTSWLL